MTVTTALPPAISPEREASLLASVPTGLLIGGKWV
jgi:succinate-semialdehyde dehydrogenase/glutarate-semialdehyde dehydrogenase